MLDTATKEYLTETIKEDEISRYLDGGRDFIDDARIEALLRETRDPDPRAVRDVLAQSLALRRLEPRQTAMLLNLEDEALWEEVFQAARTIRDRVYGPRIVTFAPLYVSNLCVNACRYCGFRRDNGATVRRRLTIDEIRRETEALVALGHKRLILVAGEHPDSDASYLADAMRAIYETKVGPGEIRRVNVNAAPQSIAQYRLLKDVGIGTFQVFQETYHHLTYRRMHPRGVKANYRWRLYALHRAQEGGIDDVAIGALFGLYDWKFEVLGLLHHAIDLEATFGGIGPHTISFPRLEPAANTPLTQTSPYRVSDRDFKRLVAVLRCSVPYTGMIITARERSDVRRDVIQVGCTQTDASSRIGIGAYSDARDAQAAERQQFLLGDTRSLDDVTRELAERGYLTSFCTAGYRCGRTGQTFMDLAKKGKVHEFCIPNAILTFKEYLLDYASPETRRIGEQLIAERIDAVPERLRPLLLERLKATEAGRRDLRF
jgi:2-iminoacetate synthase